MGVIRGVVFDLDDTLYLEKNYVLSGFRFIAETVGSDESQTDDIFTLLKRDFLSGVRGDAFNRLLAQFPSLCARWKIQDLIALYRSHSPSIQLIAGAQTLLTRLGETGMTLALITDGPVQSQSNKIAALGIGKYFAPMILTDRWGIEFRKPHLRAYEAVMQMWGLPAAQLIYIGDNPEKDFYAPRALGWQSVRLRVEGQIRHDLEPVSAKFAAEREFDNFNDLAGWLCAASALKPAPSEGPV